MKEKKIAKNKSESRPLKVRKLTKRLKRRILSLVLACYILIAIFLPYMRFKYRQARASYRDVIVYGRGPTAFLAGEALLNQKKDVLLIMPQRETVMTHYITGTSQSISVPYSLRFFAAPLRILEPTASEYERLATVLKVSTDTLKIRFQRLIENATPLTSTDSCDNYVKDIVHNSQHPDQDITIISTTTQNTQTIGHEIRAYHLHLLRDFRYPADRFRDNILVSHEQTLDGIRCTFNRNVTFVCEKLILCDEFFSRFDSIPRPLSGRYGYYLSESFPSKPFGKCVLIPPDILLDFYHDGSQMTLSVSQIAPYLFLGKQYSLSKNPDLVFDKKRLDEILKCISSLEDLDISLSPIPNWKYGPLPGCSLSYTTCLDTSRNIISVSTQNLPTSWDPLRDLLLTALCIPDLITEPAPMASSLVSGQELVHLG